MSYITEDSVLPTLSTVNNITDFFISGMCYEWTHVSEQKEGSSHG